MTFEQEIENFCKKHPKQKMTIGLCSRCDGEGYTQMDLEEMDNPISFHNDGKCYACKGTGHGFLECDICEEDFRFQQEMEEEHD